jgi:uncharacterized protein
MKKFTTADYARIFVPGQASLLTLPCRAPSIDPMSWIQPAGGGCVVNVRVIPRASKNQIQGVLGDSLKVRLQAPPVDGKANDALVRFLADTLGLPVRNISLLSGETGRNKRVLLNGLDETEARARLNTSGRGQAP